MNPGTLFTAYRNIKTTAKISAIGLTMYDQMQYASESETQELLGGPYDYQGPSQAAAVLEDLRASTPGAQIAQQILDDAADPSRTPSYVEEPPEPFPGVTPGINPDGSQGGSNIEDPEAAAQAAANADDTPSEDMTVTAKRTKRDIRPFLDQHFLLMHMYNLVNLRNQKPMIVLEDTPESELLDVDGDKKGDNVLLNTIRSIKGPMPYAYIATKQHPKEVNAAIQCVGDPAAFVNYLKASPNVQRHLDLTTKELSDLTSKIRLYKLFTRNKEPEIVEFIFETSGMGTSELEEMTKAKGKKRGYGVGIKSFNFTNQTKTVTMIDKKVTAELTLYADSLESLLRVRSGVGQSAGAEYRFTDLALKNRKPPMSKDGGRFGSISDLSFQIVVELGVTKSPSKIAGLSDTTSTMVMKLNPFMHNFDFKQDGSVEMRIDYLGVIDSAFSDPVNFDIFKNYKFMVNDYATEFAAMAVDKVCGGAKAQELRETLDKITSEGREKRTKGLLDGLRDKGQIYYVNITPPVLKAWNDLYNNDPPIKDKDPTKQYSFNREYYKNATAAIRNALGTKIDIGDNYDTLLSTSGNISSLQAKEKQAKEMQNDMEDKQPPESTIRDCAIDPNSNQVAFFYVGDLINLILENISDTFTYEQINSATTEAYDMVDAAAQPQDPNDKKQAAFANAVGIAGGIGDELLRQDMEAVARGEESNRYNELTDAMQQLEDRQYEALNHFKKLRVILGPVEMYDFFSKEKTICSIGDIPVPMRHFNEWLTGKMAKKNRYSLNDFLLEFITNYLRVYLRGGKETSEDSILQNTYEFSSVNLMGYGARFKEEGYDTDPLTILRNQDRKVGGRKSLLYDMIENDRRPLINQRSNSITSQAKKDAFDYLVFHQVDPYFAILPTIGMAERYMTRYSEQDQAKVKNLVAADKQLARKGIGVYYHGRDRGIVKEMTYTRKDSGGLRSSLLAESGRTNNHDNMLQFREMFHAKLTTFANFDVSPSDYIFIDPESVSPYLSKSTLDSLGSSGTQYMGVGGFYIVDSVSHFFEQGKFETVINTKFAKSANAQYEWIERAKQQEREKTSDKPNKAEQERIQDLCKTTMRSIDKTENATFASSKNVADKLLGWASEFATALFKALTDNSDTEISENDLESVAGGSGIPSVSSPTNGNQNTANNGPAT